MNYRKTVLSASIIAALCLSGAAMAQTADKSPHKQKADKTKTRADKILSLKNAVARNDASPQQAVSQNDQDGPQNKAQNLGTINVKGIRGSLTLSLQQKKDAVSNIDVVTAEDIGKLPAENVADALQRLPGVNVGTSSATEGGFDENDRVSLRGTNPNLTLTTINGHLIGTADWFVLSQVQTVGRAVSYGLLPAEIVKEVVVHKTSEARFLAGGAAGTVDVITRKPLEFSKPFIGAAKIGAVYADLPGDTSPQASVLVNFKNDRNTFGVMAQAFYEKRHLRRDGQEVAGGWFQIDPASPIATAHPNLANAWVPNLLGATEFTQTRVRKGGMVDVEFQPTDSFTLNFNGFYSKLEAANFNTNFMMWTSQFANQATALTGYTVRNNVVTAANFAGEPGIFYGVYDMISRPEASSQTSYITVDGDWDVNSRLNLKAQLGTTEGIGKSPAQDVVEMNMAQGYGAHWNMNGLNAISWGFNNGATYNTPAGAGAVPGWIFGSSHLKIEDKGNWGKIDGTVFVNNGDFSSINLGVRYASHSRQSPISVAAGPMGNWQAGISAITPAGSYPGDYANDFSADFPRNIWRFTPAQLAEINSKYANRKLPERLYPNQMYSVGEHDSAAYLQANFAGESWSGNLGVRLVRTDENINYYTSTPTEFTNRGPILGSAFYPSGFYGNQYQNTYTNLLPSGNLKVDLSRDLVFRVAASQTLTRPNYSALAGYISASDTSHTGSGGNPQLAPLVSTNTDMSLGWYFMPRGLVSFDLFNMDLDGYPTFATHPVQLKDMVASSAAGHDVFATYAITSPVNGKGNVKGFEFSYQQPIGRYFGFNANYTYADGHTTDPSGAQGPLFGASENTYNAQVYFENSVFSARLTYTYRSSWYAGVSHATPYYMDNAGYLSAQVTYNINDWMSVDLTMLNLNNPHLQYFAKLPNSSMEVPFSNYFNGRQYYLALHFKF
ncbi:MAG TPA: TonB-dependent receptor [Gammaproteobacteria bacterium]|nr:TonB-dependent receptor [Gammaproteobacteria bacterium]